MSSDTQVVTFQDIYTEILNKMKQPTNVASIVSQAKRYSNTGLNDLILGFEYKLPFLERSSTLILHAPYSTGTISIASGSVALLGSSSLWATNNSYGVANARISGKFTFDGSRNIYKPGAVNSDTSVTLASRYVGDSLPVGTTYTYYEDVYDLASDFLKPVNVRLFSTIGNVAILGRHDFQRRFPFPRVNNTPAACTLLDEGYNGSTTPLKRVQFSSYPSTPMLIPYSYITSNIAVSSVGTEQTAMTADSDEPNLPLRYRHGIVLQACAAWYRDKKDDARAASVDAEYKTLIGRLVGDLNIGSNQTAQVQPRSGIYAANARAPYRGSSKRYSHNNDFDYYR